MKRGNRKTDLIKGAITRLEKRLKLPDKDLIATAKRFRKSGFTGKEKDAIDVMANYRLDMNEQLNHLRTLVK